MKIFSKNSLFFFIILTIITFAIYGKSINFGITNLDDDSLITRNSTYISNIKNISKFFLTDCYFGKKTQYYRPILNISFSIEAILFKDNLKVFHITNILLFIFALYFIFIFLSKLNFNTTILKFFILLFAVHPVLSSVPVWLPARNDTLLTIFFMVSLINFINYLKTNKNIFLFFHLLFFAISLFTKETTVLLLFIYPLLIYCFNLKISKKQIVNNIIFIIPLFFLYFILRHFAVRTIDPSIYFTNFTYYVKNIIIGIMLYVEKFFYPTYMPIMLYDIKPTIQTYLVNSIVLVSLIYVYYRKIINRKIIIFSLIFSFIAIFPTFLQEEYTFLTHRLVTCLIGIIILLTLIFEQIVLKFYKTKNYLIIIFIFLFILFSYCSFMQINKYKDSFTFWNHAYIDAPNYHIVYDGLAKEFANKKLLNKALDLSLKAIELKKSFDYYLNYSIILFKQNDLINSKKMFEQILNIDNKHTLIYRYLSNIYMLEKNYTKAVEYAKKAVEYAPTIDIQLISLENLTKIYSVSSRFEEATQTLHQILKYNKNNAHFYYILSMLYEDNKDLLKAIEYIEKALTIEPNNTKYLERLKLLKK